MKNILSAHLAPILSIDKKEIFLQLETPKDSKLGDLALPCFQQAKSKREAPSKIASDLASKLIPNLPKGFTKVMSVGGYVNFFFEPEFWIGLVCTEIQNKQDLLGENLSVGGGQCAVFDYSSPNVAKPMSIGHLRSTVIGQALVNLFRAMGFRVIGINYLGDWGVQFGKLAWAHLNKRELIKNALQNESSVVQKGFDLEVWKGLLSDIQNKSEESFDYLYALYVLFHACSEIDPKLEEMGRAYFLKLEQKNSPEITAIWQKFVNVSLKEYGRVYELLNVKHDIVSGESFHEPQLRGVVEELHSKGLLTLSEGAQIVDLEQHGMPPCLIQKRDGATLYATRDIAAAIYRHDILGGTQLYYVVGAEQSLHLKQVFKVLELMGKTWADQCFHVPFGLYRFKEGKMSTRRGNVVFLEDVLDRAVELVRAIIKEKNPDLKDAESVAQAVGTGAVVFNDLMNDRVKNIDFDWDRILDFNGDTGPYVQYTHVRCCSVLAKVGKPPPRSEKSRALKEPLELAVVGLLGRFDDVLRLAFEQLKPSWIAQYLLDLSKAFNAFYYQHRIIDAEPAEKKARLVLVDATRIALHRGLSLLGIQAPTAM